LRLLRTSLCASARSHSAFGSTIAQAHNPTSSDHKAEDEENPADEPSYRFLVLAGGEYESDAPGEQERADRDEERITDDLRSQPA
jgi:hypothetical protein